MFFTLLRSKILKSEWQHLPDVLVGRARDAYSSRLGQGLETSCDVHALPKEVAVLDHYVPEMHPNAEADRRSSGSASLAVAERLLDLHRGLNGLYDARELCQDAVACRVGDPAPVLADEPVHALPMSRSVRSVPTSSTPIRRE